VPVVAMVLMLGLGRKVVRADSAPSAADAVAAGAGAGVPGTGGGRLCAVLGRGWAGARLTAWPT
jgi:hypothetical protein